MRKLVIQYRINWWLRLIYYLLWFINLFWLWYKPSPIVILVVAITFIGYLVEQDGFKVYVTYDDWFELFGINVLVWISLFCL